MAWSSLPANARSSVWMLVAVLCFSVNNVGLKELVRTHDPLQIVFLRSALIGLFILPFAWQAEALRTRRLGGHLSRSLLGIGAVYMFTTALALAPLADVIAISFSRALFLVVLAVLVLGETVGWRRWMAVLVGFVGVLVLVRPGFGAFNWGAIAAAADACISAGVVLTVKSLGRTERPQTVVLYFGVLTALLMAIPAALVWQPLSFDQWLLVTGTGALATGAHAAVTRAWSDGEASVLAPLSYLQLVFSCALAYVFFSELPDRLALLGAAIIVVATLYIALHEARGRRAPKAAVPGD